MNKCILRQSEHTVLHITALDLWKGSDPSTYGRFMLTIRELVLLSVNTVNIPTFPKETKQAEIWKPAFEYFSP